MKQAVPMAESSPSGSSGPGPGGSSPRPGSSGARQGMDGIRSRLIASAREVFQERGSAATLDDVARHAGVGVATAYRRFANKDELLEALFEDMAGQVDAVTREALADPDAWHALTSSLEKLCALQSFDRGLREVMLGTAGGSERQARMVRRFKPAVDLMVERAKGQGVLRPDAESWDVPMIQLMVSAVTDHTGERQLWRRYLPLVL
ncbi:MAG: hypothetical protein QOF98_3672, partial [Streptomyces sp.]|nr:hypothetical protein [Streptomyces sp.]